MLGLEQGIKASLKALCIPETISQQVLEKRLGSRDLVERARLALRRGRESATAGARAVPELSSSLVGTWDKLLQRSLFPHLHRREFAIIAATTYARCQEPDPLNSCPT